MPRAVMAPMPAPCIFWGERPLSSAWALRLQAPVKAGKRTMGGQKSQVRVRLLGLTAHTSTFTHPRVQQSCGGRT